MPNDAFNRQTDVFGGAFPSDAARVTFPATRAPGQRPARNGAPTVNNDLRPIVVSNAALLRLVAP